MNITLNNRTVVDIVVDDVNLSDYPDFADAYICDATWADTGVCLTDSEIDELEKQYPSLAHELAHRYFM